MKRVMINKAVCLLVWGLVLCSVPFTGVYAGIINFDEFPPNNSNVPITTLYAPVGVIFGSDNSGIWGGLSNGDTGNWGLEGTNGPAFLGNNGFNNSGTYVTSIFFSAPVSNVSFDVSRSNGSSPGQTLTASVYEGATLLDSATVTLGDINNWSLITFGLGGIDKVILDGSEDGLSPYGVDNLQFNSGSVPEPATMLLLGSGLIGLAGYGRKKFFKK